MARRLGNERCFGLLAASLAVVADNARDSATQALLQRRQWAGVAGLAFFEYLEQQGLPDAEQYVFAHPPRQVECITRPGCITARNRRTDPTWPKP